MFKIIIKKKKKRLTFSKIFIVEVSLQTWILKAVRPTREIAGNPDILLSNLHVLVKQVQS